MRLLHPKTLDIVGHMKDEEFQSSTLSKKLIYSHSWSECFKFVKSGKEHPKMFINYANIVTYLLELHNKNDIYSVGCNMNYNLIYTLNDYLDGEYINDLIWYYNEGSPEDEVSCLEDKFDRDYLISDANSLYYKGVNIFPHIYGENWHKYCPVISLKEIKRQVDKTLDKRSKKGGK